MRGGRAPVSSVSRPRPGITHISPSEQSSQDEPPPDYTPSSFSTAVPYPNRILGPETFSGLNPSNFVSVDRKYRAVIGSWLIDPHLFIVFLASLLPTALNQHVLYLSPRLSFYLQAYSSNGSITICTPRSFQGLLVLKTTDYGRPRFSADASAWLTTFGEVNGTTKCFIDDHSGMNDEWDGDEVSAETCNGTIEISYEDEDGVVAASKVSVDGGFFILAEPLHIHSDSK